MSEIRVNIKTKAKETLNMANSFRSYLFEQEYEELNNCTIAQKKTLRKALEILDAVVKKNRI